jgi:soluble lytic murein transglycosylase-like protein
MSHRSIGPDARSSHIKASQPAARAFMRQSVRTSVSNAMSSTQQRLTLLGVSSLALVAMLMAGNNTGLPASLAQTPVSAQTGAAGSAAEQPSLAAPAASPQAAPAPLSKAELAHAGAQRQQQAVTAWLSKRYRVAGDAADMLVSTAYTTARDIKLDPLLILAVMAIESGLNPFAESPVGAKGLMQVMASVHHAKFQAMGGPQMALNPAANIRVGSQILKEYVSRGGSVEAGLKTYVGAGAFDNDAGYGSRVLAELHKLKLVASGKNVPTFTPPAAPVMSEKVTAPKPDDAPVHAAPPVAPSEEVIAGL